MARTYSLPKNGYGHVEVRNWKADITNLELRAGMLYVTAVTPMGDYQMHANEPVSIFAPDDTLVVAIPARAPLGELVTTSGSMTLILPVKLGADVASPIPLGVPEGDHYVPTLSTQPDGSKTVNWPVDVSDTCVATRTVLMDLVEEANAHRRRASSLEKALVSAMEWTKKGTVVPK